jgi:tRNA 2-thiouridine synthesizing protein A
MTEVERKPTVTLDMRGTRCPAPLLGAKKLVDDLQPGETMVLLSDCPGTHDDLLAWCRQTGNRIASTARRPDGGHAYTIERGRERRHPVANTVLDMRGAVCPGPIVEAKKLLNGMQSGETLKLVSNCPGVRADVVDWAKATGFVLHDVEEVEAGTYEFYVGKP